jgi:uncharacterized protein with PIN domain
MDKCPECGEQLEEEMHGEIKWVGGEIIDTLRESLYCPSCGWSDKEDNNGNG